MATSSVIPATNPSITAAVVNNTTSTSSTSDSVGIDKNTLAGNFQTFLTLLTTQLKNQNPLDPLDTNQFTQQLVQFAQVEQQLRGNEQLTSLVNIEKAAQSTQALVFVGATVAVDGSTAQLAKDSSGKNSATWNLNAPKDASAVIN